MTKKVKKMLVVSLIVAGALVLGLGAVIYFMKISMIGDREAKIQELDTNQTELETKVKNLANMEKQLKTSMEKAKNSVSLIPDLDASEFDDLLKDISDMAKMTGVKLSDPTAVEAKEKRGGPKFPPEAAMANYELTATGTFDNVFKFLEFIEFNRRFIHVDSFVLSKADEAESETENASAQNENYVKLEITLIGFAYKITEALGVTAGKQIVEIGKTSLPPE